MVPHPHTIVTFAGIHCQDLLTTAARDRRASEVPGPALRWRTLAIQVGAFLAVCFGVVI